MRPWDLPIQNLSCCSAEKGRRQAKGAEELRKSWGRKDTELQKNVVRRALSL